MPYDIEHDERGGRIILQGRLEIDDAEGFIELVRQNPGASFDLSSCEYMHTAVFQVLYASQCSIGRMPDHAMLKMAITSIKEYGGSHENDSAD